jgi:hypothetical protein
VYRDGEPGAQWRPLDDSSGFNRFSVAPDSTALTIAYVCSRTRTGEMVYLDRAELSGLDVFCGIPYNNNPALLYEWHGDIKGIGPQDRVTLAFGSWWYGVLPVPLAVGATGYSARIDHNQHDLAALAESPDGALRLLILRGIFTNTGTGVADLDFVGALQPEQRPFALPMAAVGETVVASAAFATARERAVLALPLRVPGHMPVFHKRDLMEDTQELRIDASALPDGMRGYAVSLGEGPIVERPLPPPFTATEVVYAEDAPPGRPRATFAPYPGATFYRLIISPAAPTPAFTWTMNVGAKWLAKHRRQGGDKETIELPDLTALPGFRAAWAPDGKVPLRVEVVAVTSTLRLGAVLSDGWGSSAGGDVTAYAKKLANLPAATP